MRQQRAWKATSLAFGATTAFVSGCTPRPANEAQPTPSPTPAVSANPSPKPSAASATASPAPLPSPSASAFHARVALPVSTAATRAWKAPERARSVIRVPKQIEKPPTDFLKALPGFTVELVAGGLEHPRWLTVAPNGDLFVVESRLDTGAKTQPNRVVVVRHGDSGANGANGAAPSVWADGLYLPFGIAFHGGYLYVANTGSVVRWPYHDGDVKAPGAPEVVVDHIPELGMRQHWTRNILFSDREHRLYVTIGSKENADVEEKLRGTIVAYALDATGKPGGEPEIVASGMRNPVGLALNPATGRLWADVNERDYLGDDLVPDFLTEVKPGGFYGWPYYYIGGHHDPRLPERPDLKDHVLLPDVLLGSHGAPLGLAFTPDGRTALVARHGSQNRTKLFGYDVVRVRWDASGRPKKLESLVTGWLADPDGNRVYGRPAGLAWDTDGSLLIADDWGGRIWRVRPTGTAGF